MHELYLAECIAKQTLASLPANLSGESVSDIRVRIGDLDAVMVDTLNFMFDAIKHEHNLSAARLRIDSEQVRCMCTSCHSEFTIVEPVFVCPQCASQSVKVTRGRGITLTEITISEESNK
jgi:hydrogenase nickel incorporation protein HypA/HybF